MLAVRILAALAFAAGVFAQDLEFSHKLHLANGLNCTFCHSAASSSRSESDSLLPQAELCLACHNGQTAPEIDVSPLRDRSAVERLFWFNHERHLELGNAAPKIAAALDSGKYLGYPPDIREHLDTENSCVACHRGLDEAVSVDSKIHLPGMSDCLVCHDSVDAPFSCEECHSEQEHFTFRPADHTREFVDAHSSGKADLDKVACQACHGRNFTCMGCH